MANWNTKLTTPAVSQGPALFLDRDGVVISDRDYLADPQQVQLLPGVAPAMVRARQAGYLLVGVSNQSGLGRGYFSHSDFEAVMQRIVADLAAEGAAFDGFFYCPHAPSDDCQCRKPLTGMLAEAAAFFAWDPARSWVIGDKSSDVELGQAAGLGSILVRTGYGAQQEAKVMSGFSAAQRVLVADDLAAAVDLILAIDDGNSGAGNS